MDAFCPPVATFLFDRPAGEGKPLFVHVIIPHCLVRSPNHNRGLLHQVRVFAEIKTNDVHRGFGVCFWTGWVFRLLQRGKDGAGEGWNGGRGFGVRECLVLGSGGAEEHGVICAHGERICPHHTATGVWRSAVLCKVFLRWLPHEVKWRLKLQSKFRWDRSRRSAGRFFSCEYQSAQ